jgi:tetratricopeptide (TPR) repeat protein
MKKMQQPAKVVLLSLAILICVGAVLSMSRESLEDVSQKALFLTPLFAYLDLNDSHDSKVLFLGSSRFVSCIKSDTYANLSGMEQAKVLNLAADGGGTWEELLVCRRYPGLMDASPLVVVEVEPWMFNKNLIHPIFKTQHPFEPYFYTWATFAERIEFPDIKTKTLLVADYFWPFSERRKLVEWNAVIKALIQGKHAEPHLSVPIYHYQQDAYLSLANNPAFSARQIVQDHLNDFEFADYKAEYLRRLIGLAEKRAKRIVLVQPPVRREYIDAIYSNPQYLDTYIHYVLFIHGLESGKVASIIWQTPEDCGLTDSIFIDYGHFNAKGAQVFTQRLFQELKASGLAGSDAAEETGPRRPADADIQRLEETLKADPGSMTIMQSLAIAYSMRGDYDKALGTLEKMRALQPGRADTYYNISCIKAKQGKVSESVEWLGLAVSKGFRNRSLMVTDKDLDAIKGNPGFRDIVHKLK